MVQSDAEQTFRKLAERSQKRAVRLSQNTANRSETVSKAAVAALNRIQIAERFPLMQRSITHSHTDKAILRSCATNFKISRLVFGEEWNLSVFRRCGSGYLRISHFLIWVLRKGDRASAWTLHNRSFSTPTQQLILSASPSSRPRTFLAYLLTTLPKFGKGYIICSSNLEMMQIYIFFFYWEECVE